MSRILAVKNQYYKHGFEVLEDSLVRRRSSNKTIFFGCLLLHASAFFEEVEVDVDENYDAGDDEKNAV